MYMTEKEQITTFYELNNQLIEGAPYDAEYDTVAQNVYDAVVAFFHAE